MLIKITIECLKALQNLEVVERHTEMRNSNKIEERKRNESERNISKEVTQHGEAVNKESNVKIVL